jgi:hypothetical protein
MPQPKIGQLVLYTGKEKPSNPRENKPVEYFEWPALIYKLHGEHDKIVGLFVFGDNGVEMIRSCPWDGIKKPETWRFQSQDY